MARRHGVDSEDLSDIVSHFPNQIKSLFLASVNPAAVANNWFSSNVDAVIDPEVSSKFSIMHNLINRVEVLTSYDGDIKRGVWKTLTHGMWDTVAGTEMICRMKPYESKLLGIYRPKSLEMPTYDEYFILTPRQLVSVGIDFGGNLDAGVLDNSNSMGQHMTDNGFTNGIDYNAGDSSTNNTSGGTGSYDCDEEAKLDA